MLQCPVVRPPFLCLNVYRQNQMKKEYITQGVCSRCIYIDVDDNGILNKVDFCGGCSGNTQGVARLAEGMHVDEVIRRLEGIRCGAKSTSCPDQLAKALKEMRS